MAFRLGLLRVKVIGINEEKEVEWEEDILM